jgi:hypothetical protein
MKEKKQKQRGNCEGIGGTGGGNVHLASNSIKHHDD